MLRLAAVALGIIAVGVAIGTLVAYTIPSASVSQTATSWAGGAGNHHQATALPSDDQMSRDYGSAPPPLPPQAQLANQPQAADQAYGPDDRDRIDGRDEPQTGPGYDVNGGDVPDRVDDRAAQAADAARDAADDARAAGAAPPEPARDDR
jgi:hypothetical protein